MSAKLEQLLYIDDDEDILTLAKMTLEAVGNYTVDICNNGQEGIEKALEIKPDLIMIDVMMPVMDGLMTLQKMLEYDALTKIPIVFMTARIQPEEVQSYLQKGATAVISKPFDPMELSGQIKQAWEDYYG